MSSSWTNIFKTGNDTDQETLDNFREFHCADCLKSFQQQQNEPSNKCNKPNRSKMNTPPPPLQPITDEAMNGLYHYFGQPSTQPTLTSLRLITNNNVIMNEHPAALVGNFINEDKQQSLQETRLTLNRKLAQRVPKQELVERGILPRKFIFIFWVKNKGCVNIYSRFNKKLFNLTQLW